MTHVASVGPCWSNYDDKIWSWLNKQKVFTPQVGLPEEPYDYILSWGYLVAAGCEFSPPSEDPELPDDYWDIGFNGSIAELIARLDRLIGQLI